MIGLLDIPEKHTLSTSHWLSLCYCMGMTNFEMIEPALWSFQSMYQYRTYHNMDHVDYLLQKLWFARSNGYVYLTEEQSYIIQFSIWFHDYIYIPMSLKNEENSAYEAAAFLRLNSRADLINEVHAVIMATKAKRYVKNTVGALMYDLDRLILAAPEDIYKEYTQNIRREYKDIYYQQYEEGRWKFLLSLVNDLPIFQTESIRAEAEKHALKNVLHELQSLYYHLETRFLGGKKFSHFVNPAILEQ